MIPLQYAIQRVRGILREISHLKDEDFPYPHPKDALNEIEKLFQQRLDTLSDLTSDDNPDVVRSLCSESLLLHAKYLPLLGFLIRSTHVRNSFEVIGPLLRLARKILGPKARLVLSCEWKLSPHVYPPLSDLPNYVLLGLPASESENPFLVPLAGHELGHTAWKLKKLSDEFGPFIFKHILQTAKKRSNEYEKHFGRQFGNDLIDRDIVTPAYQWSLRQAEETYCDLLGLRLFGTSYLHAFAYLLSPGGIRRAVRYPSLRTRIQCMLTTAESLNIDYPEKYSEWFLDDIKPEFSDSEKFMLELADNATESAKDLLLSRARDLADNALIPTAVPTKIDQVIEAFKLLTPAANIGDLSSILNAAWDLYDCDDLWPDHRLEGDPVEVLKELVLKSIEILEFEEKMRETDDSKE